MRCLPTSFWNGPTRTRTGDSRRFEHQFVEAMSYVAKLRLKAAAATRPWALILFESLRYLNSFRTNFAQLSYTRKELNELSTHLKVETHSFNTSALKFGQIDRLSSVCSAKPIEEVGLQEADAHIWNTISLRTAGKGAGAGSTKQFSYYSYRTLDPFLGRIRNRVDL